MMKSRKVQFGPFAYDFVSGEGSLDALPGWLADKPYDRFVLIADTGIPDWIVARTKAVFAAVAPADVLRFAPGESCKNLTTVQELAEQTIALGADRRTAIVALGGGVTGNVAGIVAGLLFRGLPLLHIPTTLMAASDSVLSLKQAVNLQAGKNLAGFYYTPQLVCVELSFLEALPAREVRAGMCELVKNLLTIKPGHIPALQPLLRTDNVYSAEELQTFIDFCIDAKTAVMRDDPYEKKEALVLEYGHTIGHALELVSDGEFVHGECVAFGMRCAARIARRIGLLAPAEVEQHDRLIDAIGVDIRPSAELLPGIEAYMKKDNKRGYRQAESGKTALILLSGLGELARDGEAYVTLVDNKLILEVIEEQLVATKSAVMGT
ncbi:2-deoxy-scyllo-inosose synthase [Paenibacillus athensensis]|nr:2-deoxy-scyllo-inosose synthase [Paenibacillus athensensis]